jgi:hypothetical protein
MRYLFLIPIVLLFGAACSNSRCIVDRNSRDTFLQQMKIVKEQYLGPHPVLVDDYRNAIRYLAFITDSVPHADISTTIGYTSPSQYKNDMTFWNGWYKSHKCMLTQQYVDSALKHNNFKWVGKKYGGY